MCYVFFFLSICESHLLGPHAAYQYNPFERNTNFIMSGVTIYCSNWITLNDEKEDINNHYNYSCLVV